MVLGRPYVIFVNGRMEAETRNFENARDTARGQAKANPGATVLVNDDWCDRVRYRCRVNPETGRLWAGGR